MALIRNAVIKTKEHRDVYVFLVRNIVSVDSKTVVHSFRPECLAGKCNIRLINAGTVTAKVKIWSSNTPNQEDLKLENLETIIALDPEAVYNTGGLNYTPGSYIFAESDQPNVVIRVEASENGAY